MILAAVGDAMGYYNGRWEFQRSSEIINKEFNEMTKEQGCKGFTLDIS